MWELLSFVPQHLRVYHNFRAIPSIFIPFICPLKFGEHMIYGWTNKRYTKGTLLLIGSRISLSMGRLPKVKGIDKWVTHNLVGYDSNQGPKWTFMDWWQTVNVLKAYHRQWHTLWVGGMNFERLRLEWSLPSSHSSLTMVKGQTKHVKCVQTSIEQAFIKVKT